MRKGGLILAAGRVRSKKNKNTEKSAAPKTHHEVHSSTPTTATKHETARDETRPTR